MNWLKKGDIREKFFKGLYDEVANIIVAVSGKESCPAILDVGCGDGELYYALQRKNFKFKYVGVDVDEGAVEKLRKKGLNCVKGDVFNLELDEFDVVACVNFLEQFDVEKYATIIDKLKAFLKDGGKLVATVTNKQNPCVKYLLEKGWRKLSCVTPIEFLSLGFLGVGYHLFVTPLSYDKDIWDVFFISPEEAEVANRVFEKLPIWQLAYFLIGVTVKR